MVELDDLRQFSENSPLPPPPLEQLERRVEQRRRRRWGTTALVVAALLVAAGVAVASRGGEDELRTISVEQNDERTSSARPGGTLRSTRLADDNREPDPVRDARGHGPVDRDDSETTDGQQVAGNFENLNRMERWWLSDHTQA